MHCSHASAFASYRLVYMFGSKVINPGITSPGPVSESLFLLGTDWHARDRGVGVEAVAARDAHSADRALGQLAQRSADFCHRDVLVAELALPAAVAPPLR